MILFVVIAYVVAVIALVLLEKLSNNCINRIYNKILDRDWFSVRLFVT